MKSFLETMRYVKENLAAFLFLMMVLSTILGTGTAIGVNWLDRRIALHTDPLVDILMWDLTDSGRLQAYKIWKSEQEANKKAFEIQSASESYPEVLRHSN